MLRCIFDVSRTSVFLFALLQISFLESLESWDEMPEHHASDILPNWFRNIKKRHSIMRFYVSQRSWEMREYEIFLLFRSRMLKHLNATWAISKETSQQPNDRSIFWADCLVCFALLYFHELLVSAVVKINACDEESCWKYVEDH